MKIKKVERSVKCEMCDCTQDDKSEGQWPYGTPNGYGHTMLILSVFDPDKKKRKYLEFCSNDCLAKWANSSP